MFRRRDPLPRAFQTLYLNVVSAAFQTSRHVILSTCPGTATARTDIGLSLDTLRYDTDRNILAIAHFDAFLRIALVYDILSMTNRRRTHTF